MFFKLLTKKQKITVLITLVVGLVVTAGASILVYKFSNRTPVVLSDEFRGQLAEVSANATDLENDGDIDEALSVYDELIEQTRDREARALLLDNKATIAFRNDRLGDAMQLVSEALVLHSNPDRLALAGAIARRLGNTREAIDYYEQALAAYEAHDVREEVEEDAIRQIITDLRAGATGN